MPDSISPVLREASSAEEIFGWFGVPFDQAVVNVNRLHILKRFNQYLSAAGGPAGRDADPTRARELLARAYGDFVSSSAIEQKVFKVFQKGTTQRIGVDALRGTRKGSSHA
ncbi:MAG: nitrogenase-stabilizing/protective protein NifW [Betaproteobacteria bacterium]|nr:nitrogenase-stabilizing/protective protein NifW [Betaproteobacteria bacterium]